MKKISDMSSDELKKISVKTLMKRKIECAFKIADLCVIQNAYASRLGYNSWSDIPKTEFIYKEICKQEQEKYEYITEYNYCSYILSNRKSAIKGRKNFEEHFPKKNNG